MQRGAALLRHTLQGVHRTEVRRGQHHGRAVRHAGEVAEYHAEAVIERHRDAEPIVVREPHALADPEAVVEDIVVREHRALGKPGGAGGVLDVDNVVEIERGLTLGELSRRSLICERKQLGPGQGVAFPITRPRGCRWGEGCGEGCFRQQDDAAQVRELFRAKIIATGLSPLSQTRQCFSPANLPVMFNGWNGPGMFLPVAGPDLRGSPATTPGLRRPTAPVVPLSCRPYGSDRAAPSR